MQPGTAVFLPGGMMIDGQLVREAAFRPLTGCLEQQLIEVVDEVVATRPARVSAVLALALAKVGDVAATDDLIAGLSVADRQFLMLAFELEWGDDQQWRHVTCRHCGSLFDVGFRISELPLKPAGESYPWAQIVRAEKKLRLRVPIGSDEVRAASLPAQGARRSLALGCVMSIDDSLPTPQALEAFCEADIDAIDSALDITAPELATQLHAVCSECGAGQSLDLDPYRRALPDVSRLYRDVHALASHYHWSEAQILRLPRARRQFYLDMIELGHESNH